MSKFAITGGHGFIGGALVKKLLEDGHGVRVLSRSARNSGDGRVEYVKADYNDAAALAQVLRGCDGVFHLAAAIFAYNYDGFAKANIDATKNLAAAAVQAGGIKFFIYMSSMAAGGYSADYLRPRTEEDTPEPVSDYGKTKLAGEEFVKKLPPEIKTVILRPPAVYGKNDSGVSKIAAWVKKGVMVNTSEGDTYFNFVHVDDLVSALVTAIGPQVPSGETFYICENKVYSWKYFIEAMARAMGKKTPFMFTAPLRVLKIIAFFYETSARIFNFAPALNYDKVKEAAIKGHWAASSEKWVKLTGQKFTPLDEGLKKSF